MSFDFPLIIVCVTAFFGIVSLVDWIFSKVSNVYWSANNKPLLIDYARSFFPVLLFVLVLRSFCGQLYRVPTGSLKPTVMPGDLILVSQYDYGLRFPVWWRHALLKTGTPKVGQIALVHWPVNPRMNFVKRVVGVPGDHISYINKVFYINGKIQPQTFVRSTRDSDGVGQRSWSVKVYKEVLNGVSHEIYINPKRLIVNFHDLVVPKGKYFLVGDNRDNSDDSRYWGFATYADLIGRAHWVVLNWNPNPQHWWEKINWKRVGNTL